jgi:hypothetical protein
LLGLFGAALFFERQIGFLLRFFVALSFFGHGMRFGVCVEKANSRGGVGDGRCVDVLDRRTGGMARSGYLASGATGFLELKLNSA